MSMVLAGAPLFQLPGVLQAELSVPCHVVDCDVAVACMFASVFERGS